MVRNYIAAFIILFPILGCSRDDLAPFEFGDNENVIPINSNGIILGPRVAGSETPSTDELDISKNASYEPPAVVENDVHTNNADNEDENDELEKGLADLSHLKTEKVKDKTPAIKPKNIEKKENITKNPAPKNDKTVKPLSGKIISKYKQVEDGYQNDGVNIQGKLGAPVQAFRAGKVIYTGNKLQEYGNIVVIKHDGDLVSTYAHLQSATVKVGQSVNAGDIIGKVGKTGYVESPQLHFQLMKNSQPVDPFTYFK